MAKLKEEGEDAETDKFSWGEVKKAFKLPQVWFVAFIFLLDGTFFRLRGDVSQLNLSYYLGVVLYGLA